METLPKLKCQALLNSLHQKKYHFFNDEDIRNIIVNYDDKEWYALTYSKKILQFYLDNPDSGIPYDKDLVEGDAMMMYYDNLVYRIAKNRSKMLTLSPSFAERVYEEFTGKNTKDIKLSKHPFVWVVVGLYLAWVILLFSLSGSQPFWQTVLIAIFGGPEFVLGLILMFCLLQFVIIAIYNAYLECRVYLWLRRHSKSEYGEIEKKQADYLAARLAPSPNR